ncbi:MAG: membrane protein insertase YidC [Reichenbachiella sp.]
MDRNQIAGMVVMLILMTVYFQFFAPETPEPIAEQTTEQANITSVATTQNVVTTNTSGIVAQIDDSLVNQMQKEKFGIFAPFANGVEEELALENEDFKLVFSNKGGLVKSVVLKDYLTFDKQPLLLLDENSSRMNFFLTSNYKPVNISELYYTTDVKKGDTTVVTFTAQLADGSYIQHLYKIPKVGFQLKYSLNLVGLDGIVDNVDAQVTWANDLKKVEQALKDARQKTTVNYMTLDGDVDNIGSGNGAETEEIIEPVKWFTFKQKFFATGLIADNQFTSSTYSSIADENDTSYVKKANATLVIPIGDLKTGNGNFTYYFGPNDYQITKQVTPGFEENVDLGWKLFRVVNVFLIIPVFNFLQQYISNYGVIIIILVFLIRMILAPLTYTSHMSMAKMKVLKPEMDAIKEKNGDDQQKSQQETMALYGKAGVNPLSGCIPMLLQFPFLLAMFNFFPNSIELRQQAFLWATDLSTYDSILSWEAQIPLLSTFYGNHVSLFTLLMTASTLAVTYTNSQMNSQMQGPMKSMQYMMPIMFLFFLNSYSAGLTFYYFVSNMVSFGQTAFFKTLVDEDKIKKVLEENRSKNANKKKSKFQQKLGEAMKAGDQARKDKKKKK